MAVCLAAGALIVALPTHAFVLSWTHSVEKTLWRESWRVEGSMLVLDEAEVEGSGAGMEPAPNARLSDGAWHYRPALQPLQRLRLAHSEFAGDYTLCWSDKCVMLGKLVDPGAAGALEIFSCAAPALTQALECQARPQARADTGGKP
jgi:hypothetical protein